MTGTPITVTAGAPTPGRPARPVRDPDPKRNAAYWARIDRLVGLAPPLSDEQRARLRAIFHQPSSKEAA
ncbi:hypothetical protein ACFWNG_04010 [Streptomyces sp. NPDC058391]|uniref:hypothetical protein n=1 Tax=Streptomyces sp. NPDC058391 TaxID=3346476 RepID=UPI003669408B